MNVPTAPPSVSIVILSQLERLVLVSCGGDAVEAHPAKLKSSTGEEWKKRDFDSLPPGERELAGARSQFFNTALQRALGPVPEQARGLYVVTEPRLGLALHK